MQTESRGLIEEVAKGNRQGNLLVFPDKSHRLGDETPFIDSFLNSQEERSSKDLAPKTCGWVKSHTFFRRIYPRHDLPFYQHGAREGEDCWDVYVAALRRAWKNAMAPRGHHLWVFFISQASSRKKEVGWKNLRSAVKRMTGGSVWVGMLWSGDIG